MSSVVRCLPAAAVPQKLSHCYIIFPIKDFSFAHVDRVLSYKPIYSFITRWYRRLKFNFKTDIYVFGDNAIDLCTKEINWCPKVFRTSHIMYMCFSDSGNMAYKRSGNNNKTAWELRYRSYSCKQIRPFVTSCQAFSILHIYDDTNKT